MGVSKEARANASLKEFENDDVLNAENFQTVSIKFVNSGAQ